MVAGSRLVQPEAKVEQADVELQRVLGPTAAPRGVGHGGGPGELGDRLLRQAGGATGVIGCERCIGRQREELRGRERQLGHARLVRLDQLQRPLEVEQSGAARVERLAPEACVGMGIACRSEAHRSFEVPGRLGRLMAQGSSQGIMDRLAVGGQPERVDRLGVRLVHDGDPARVVTRHRLDGQAGAADLRQGGTRQMAAREVCRQQQLDGQRAARRREDAKRAHGPDGKSREAHPEQVIEPTAEAAARPSLGLSQLLG